MTMKSVYKKLLYKDHTSLKYYKIIIIIFGYLSYNIYISIVHSNLGRFKVFPTRLLGIPPQVV